MITHNTYSTQLFQLRFKVLPQLSGKVENERERLNTVLKCARPYPTLQVKLYLVRYNLLQDCQPPVGPYARIKLRFKTFKIKYFWAQNTIKMKRKVRRIHWYTAENEKTNDTKVIKDQTYCIFL